MSNKLTPAQKAAAKAFVKHLRALEKRSDLPRKEFCRLLGLREGTYRDYLSRFSLPNEATQGKIRDAAERRHATLKAFESELFSFLAVTAPVPF